MKATIKLLLAAVLLLPAARLTAQEAPLIDEASVMILPADPGAATLAAAGDGSFSDTVGQFKKIFNYAMKVYNFIVKNKPVVNIQTDYSNAVPEGVTHWQQLTGWQGPESKVYTFTAKNVGGLPAVTASYKVHYVWGASFQGGGRYLTGVTIEPISVVTSWGTKLDVKVEVPDETVRNAGTEKDPVAQMDVKLKWHIKTFTQTIDKEAVYRVRGDGALQEVGELFERGRLALKLEAAEKAIAGSSFDGAEVRK